MAQQGKPQLLWKAAADYPATHTPYTPPHCNTTHSPATCCCCSPTCLDPLQLLLDAQQSALASGMARLMAPPAPATVAGATRG